MAMILMTEAEKITGWSRGTLQRHYIKKGLLRAEYEETTAPSPRLFVDGDQLHALIDSGVLVVKQAGKTAPKSVKPAVQQEEIPAGWILITEAEKITGWSRPTLQRNYTSKGLLSTRMLRGEYARLLVNETELHQLIESGELILKTEAETATQSAKPKKQVQAMPGWCSIKEAAEMAGCSLPALYRNYVGTDCLPVQTNEAGVKMVCITDMQKLIASGFGGGKRGPDLKQRKAGSGTHENSHGGQKMPLKPRSQLSSRALPKTTYPALIEDRRSSLVQLWIYEKRPADSTITAMECAVRSYQEITGITRTDAITRRSIIDWRSVILDERGLAESTWNNYIRHLKVLLKLITEGYGYDNPQVMRSLKQIPVTKTKKKTISKHDLQHVMNWLDDVGAAKMPPVWFWKIVFRFLYYTGVRRRQLVGLQWSDIDFQHKTIHLRAEHSKTKREWFIPLAPVIEQELTQLAEQFNRMGCNPAGDNQVFNVTLFNPTYHGTRTNEDQLTGLCRRIRNATGVDFGVHMFRHTLATNLAGDGNNLKDLQQMLGHTSIKTTMQYVRPSVQNMLGMMNGLDAI